VEDVLERGGGMKIKVYDNGGKTFDRYTVVIERKTKGALDKDMYGMSFNPNSPQGFNQYEGPVGSGWTARQLAKQLGKRLKWSDVPEEVKRAAKQRLEPGMVEA
jgi:hypothetical protein